MSYVSVPVSPSDTYDGFVRAFLAMAITNSRRGGDSNLVLVDPEGYQGSYGGVFRPSAVAEFRRLGHLFVDGSVTDMRVVWWSLPRPARVGDMGLARDGRVGVTPEVFEEMRPRDRFFRTAAAGGRSSYWGRRAR